MFSKLALFTAATMAVFVAASSDGGISNSCNTGEVQCCWYSTTTFFRLSSLTCILFIDK